MDALDDLNRDDREGGEENVDADEREGNRGFSKQPSSDHPDDLDDDGRYNQDPRRMEQNLVVEERMKRLQLNDQSQDEIDPKALMEAQRMVNMQRNMRSQREDIYANDRNTRLNTQFSEDYDDGYQQYDDYKGSQAPDFQDESRDNTQNNMLIMQYESVLQSVNREFQNLLNKNKETEEELNMTKIKMEQLQRAYENEVSINSGTAITNL